MASTATTLAQAEQNLLRWQARLSEAKALHRRKVAEARNFFPTDEEKQREYTAKSLYDKQRYQRFVERAVQELATEQNRTPIVPVEPAAAKQSGSCGWWKRLLRLLRKR